MKIPAQMTVTEFLAPYTKGMSYMEIFKARQAGKLPEWRKNEIKISFDVPEGFSSCTTVYDYNRNMIYKHFVSTWSSSYDRYEQEAM